MKKTMRKLLIATLAFSSSLCLFAACGGKKLEAVKDYEWTYNPEFQDPCDEDMTIDGVLNETRWEGQDWLTHTSGNVTVKYTTIFTEKGLYIGAVANDKDIQWNTRFNMGYYDSYLGSTERDAEANNSAFWFRISATKESKYSTFTAFNFFVDVKDRASRNQTRFQADTTLNGELGTADEMTTEFFVTWEALCLDDDIPEGQSYPESVRICPAYRYVKTDGDSSNKWVLPTFYSLSASRLLNNGVFKATGYGNPEVDGLPLGSAANGNSKSDGWDLSQLDSETPSVTSAWGHDQAIFFKDIDSGTYAYSAKVKLTPQTWGIGAGGAGLIDMVSPTEFVSLYIYPQIISNKQVLIGLYGNLRDLGYANTRYSDKTLLKLPYDEKYVTEGITLSVVKNGSWMYYFAEGQLVYAGRMDMLQGKSAPGLYTLTREAVFTELEATDYSDNEEGLYAELNQYVYAVTTEANGGVVTPDKLTVKVDSEGVATEDLTLTVEPTSGYVLTSLEIEGTKNDSDYYQYALDHMQDCAFTIPKADITGNISVKAKFTAFRVGATKNATIRLRGKVTAVDDGSNVNDATVTLKGDSEQMTFKTKTVDGSYSFYALRAGTYEVGGRQFTVSGNYTITIEGTGYEKAEATVTIPAEQTENMETAHELITAILPEVLNKNMVMNEDGLIVNDGTLDGSSNYWYLTGSGKSVYLNTDIVTDGWQTRAGGNTQGTDGIIIKVGDTVRRVLFAGSGVYVFDETDGTHDASGTGATQYTHSGLTDANGNYAIYQSMVEFGKYFDTSVNQQTAMETPYGRWYGDAGKYTYGRLNNTTATGNVSTNVTYIIDGGNLYIALDGEAYVSLDLDCLFYGKLTADTVFVVGYASSGHKYGGANYNQGSQTEVWYSYKTNSILFGDDATEAIETALALFE